MAYSFCKDNGMYEIASRRAVLAAGQKGDAMLIFNKPEDNRLKG